MPIYSLQRDARNFVVPDTYWPERWLIAEGVEHAPKEWKFVHDPNAFTPFSFGPYNCVGKNLALVEMKMLVCHLVQKLDFKFAEGADPEEYERMAEDKFIFVVGRLPTVITRRD